MDYIKCKASKNQRMAVIDPHKCKPKKCNKECKTRCPVEKQGKTMY